MLLSRIFQYIKEFKFVLIALIFSIWGMVIRFIHLAKRDLWGDELYQLSCTWGPFKPIWQRLPNGEVTCFPGDYLLNYFFVQFFGKASKWGIMIPHIIITAIGFYILYLLCRRHLKTSLGVAVTFLITCFNGNLIFHSFEFRPYAVLPTLSLISFYLADLIINQAETLSGFKKFLIWLFFVITVIYHAAGLLIISVCLLYFLIIRLRVKNGMKKALPFLLAVYLAAIPIFIWYASGTTSSYESSQGRGIRTFDSIPNPLVDWHDFLRSIFADLMDNKKYGQKLLVYGIWIAFLLPQNKDRLKQIGFLLLLIFLPIEITMLSSVQHGYWFLDRQFIWVMTLYAFFVGWCWDAVVLFVTGKVRQKKA